MLQMPLIPQIQMLKINLWMLCKVPQIRLRVLQVKIKHRVPQVKIKHRVPQMKIRCKFPQFRTKLKVLQVQVPAQGPAQVGQNIPVQPPQQPAPVQPAPAGIVVPAPQIVYQNWIGKKPNFSGKPEEDAESHLLSTRDWIGSI